MVKKAVNFHAAILPKYRGRHGAVWALINDEKELGVTVHEIDDGFDSGKILSIERFSIDDDLSLKDIQNKSFETLEFLLKNFFTQSLNVNSPIPKENIYWRARNSNDSNICWNLSARKIFLFVRSLSRPNIYARSCYKKDTFHFKSVRIEDRFFDKIAGTVVFDKDCIFISTGDEKSVQVLDYSGIDNAVLQEGMVLH